MGLRIGIDLGGTKIEVVALTASGEVLLRRRVPTPQGDYAATLRSITELVDSAERETGERGQIGIAIPGSESTIDGKIKNANSTCLIGKPLRRDLQFHLGRDVRLANDANCFALSEAVDGAGRDGAVVFGVILGTGVGGGIVVDRRVLDGTNRIAGEWGHNRLPGNEDEDLPPPPCYCGRTGCIETWLSGPGLSADHRRHHGEGIDAPEIVSRAAAGDEACEATLGRYQRRLAKALAQVINILDPDVIVLGGGLSNIGSLYEIVPQLWTAHVFSDTVHTLLRRNVHGDSSGVRGAAWLWGHR